jgi:hypothetical protein
VSALTLLQRDFLDYLLHDNPAIRQRIASTPKAGAAERLMIYREAYRIRLLEVLKTDYPVLRSLVGDGQFEAMGHTYIKTHPSQQRSVRWFGQHLAGFLRRTFPYSDNLFLAEMAHFEWLLTLCFDAADGPVFPIDKMARIHPQNWGKMRFTLHPSVRCTALIWNTPAVWKSVSENQQRLALQKSARGQSWVVWRQDLKTYFRSLDPLEAHALGKIKAGSNFAAMCAGLSNGMKEEQIALYAAGLLKRWIGDGLISKIRLPG